jgi:hypothetical protein
MNIVKLQLIENKIYTVRGPQVMLDNDLAELYQVETKVLNQGFNNVLFVAKMLICLIAEYKSRDHLTTDRQKSTKDTCSIPSWVESPMTGSIDTTTFL